MTRVDYTVYFVIQTDALHPNVSFETTLKAALDGGVRIVQLREKKASTREFLRLARIAKELCDQYNAVFIVNDRVDIALAVGAGLHIGQDDMPLLDARALLGKDKIIGISCTTPEEAIEAVAGGADYLGIGPCYDTQSKTDLKTTIGPRGAALILQAVNQSNIPTVIIGGVHPHNIKRVMHGSVAASGKRMDGVAVVSAIASSPDPRTAALELRSSVQEVHQRSQAQSSKPAQDAASIIEAMSSLFKATRSKGGVIQNITNTVVQNDCANVCLALSSSPIMSSEAQEADELGKIVGALVVNVGTLGPAQIQGMLAASRAANANGTPLLLDPVGVGASAFRQQTTADVLNAAQFTVIKGNAGEIAYLAKAEGATVRGVDSQGKLADPAKVVQDLARQERCIVAMTGPEDYISDGTTTVKLSNGHSYLGTITGSGCMTGSAIGCFLSSARSTARSQGEDAFALTHGSVLAATVAGIASMSIAGERAAARSDVAGPGSFRAALIDELHALTAEAIADQLKIQVTSSL